MNTPGQVAFSPDGDQLIVTTKANGSSIDVFRVSATGRCQTPRSSTPSRARCRSRSRSTGMTTSSSPRPGPTRSQRSTFTTTERSRLLHAVPTGQAATCWIVGTNGQFYASNAGSASLTRVQSGPGGTLTVLGNTGTDPGSVDAAISAHGHYLYVQTGANGNVDEFRINGDGSLTPIGSVTVANAIGGEGIVAI